MEWLPYVLVVLGQELDDAISRNHDVAYGCLLFLMMWNSTVDNCDAMSRYNGVRAVLQAMRAFRNDADIQYATIGCFYKFTLDNEWKRLREQVEGAAIPDNSAPSWL